ncbi:MAG: hypothetical protein COU46_02045 [Candidatus Niyogibacteria bacterium CG10_big_fil_rev_8_21_14_0_10_42_19]|uniref:Uncharacterized protein n=1 Tax=Candidatus Niyogibacteria bacterium CG10_big_fil_rev_8_21_14_0_10_42_19 TaxID=1974725 RepID=A0A2H0TFK6_9BACT|nr:MAG: hypothetical protein COU46_02045 [Candidatus Niyogibacteria bacterium CG10_big_fil_rev_8_21_14_0_10_42_19]
MKVKVSIFVFLLTGLIFISGARAETGTIFWDEETFVFNNENCVSTDSCDLKTFWVNIKKYNVWVEGDNFGTVMMAGYIVDQISALENYGIVQFMRGCSFESVKNDNGAVVNEIDRSFLRQFFENYVPNIFPKWVIDSDDKDPLYNGQEPPVRIYHYRWAGDSGKEFIYGIKKPTFPELYVVKHPGIAFVKEVGRVKNMSMEFKTCVYKMKDIPLKTSSDDTGFAEPIGCFTWISSFIYNFDTREYESFLDVDSVCLTDN